MLAVLFNLQYARPISLIDRPDDYYLTNEATTTSHDELMPIWVKEKPTARPASRLEVVAGEVKLGPVFENAKQIQFAAEAEAESEIQVNTVYFPGWQAKVDGQRIPLRYDNKQGLIRLEIMPGKHHVLVEFGETPVRLLADIISLGSLLVVGGIFIRKYKNEKQ